MESGETIAEDDDYSRYFISLYFIVQTVTTVGYGDVNPTSRVERIFVVVTMLIGVFTFSFVSGGLASLLQAIDDQSSSDQATESKLA